MCGRPIKVQESVANQHGPRCYRKYVAMGSPVQTTFEFEHKPSRWDGLSMMEAHRLICKIIEGRASNNAN